MAPTPHTPTAHTPPADPTPSESFAMRDPHLAARVVIRAHQSGGDVVNAWQVLVSAIGPDAAMVAVDTAGRDFPDTVIVGGCTIGAGTAALHAIAEQLTAQAERAAR